MTGAGRQTFSRAGFLRLSSRLLLGLAGALGLGGLVRFFSHQPGSSQQRIFDLGPAADFPASGRLLRPEIPAVIYRTAAGFQAYSLICTHLGCTLEEKGVGFFCPCHGSEFTREGRVIQGPAAQRLRELEVELTEEGHLVLQEEGWGS